MLAQQILLQLTLVLSGLEVTTTPALPASSDEEAPSAIESVDETLIVTASRYRQAESDVIPQVDVLGERELELAPALTAPDLLQQVAGFGLIRQVSSLAAHPTAQSVSLRGIGGTAASRTLVLFDGVPLNDPFGGWVNWSRVPVEALSRAEVVKGGGSGVWGNLAVGGVIHLLTSPIEGRRLEVALKGGERGLVDATAGIGRSFGRGSLFARAQVLEHDGFHNVEASQRGPVDEPLFTEYATAYLRGRLEPRENVALRADLSWLEDDRGNGVAFQRNTIESAVLSAGLERVGSDGVWSLDLFAQDNTYVNSFSSVDLERTVETPSLDQFDVPSEALGLGGSWSGGLGRRHLLAAGGDLQLVEGVTNEDFLWTGSSFARRRRAGGEQRLAGLYVADGIEAGPRLQVELALRADRWESRNGFFHAFEKADGRVLADTAFPDNSETELSPRLGLRYELGGDLVLRTVAYGGFRAPTVNELYKPFRASGGIVNEANAELVPETVEGWEIGLDHRRGRALRARLNAFWMEIDDPVINLTLSTVGAEGGFRAPCGFVPPFGVCRQRENVGTQRNRGVELELDGAAGRSWSWSLNWLATDVEVTEAPQQQQLVGLEPRLIPDQSVTARIAFSDPRLLSAQLFAKYTGERFADDLEEFPLPEQLVVDLSLSRSITDRVSLFAAVQNVFDEREAVDATATLVRINGPRRAFGGIRLALSGGP